ncbi:carbon starvation CstA family protein, partial [Xanthovirga aplysinae]|uniref:carbon starvation CstA family protein n=1 Tax=Xanthovirga aplysinae TaxID=2529853 RepID=UPI0012BCC7D3
YGRFLDRTFEVNDNNPTPSHTDYDGVDRVPTKSAVLLGHHFSSIAGAGPVVGPIIAGLAFGWLPALLWIVLGSIFFGGVHDYTSLMASIRHKAKSVAEIAKEHMSPLAYRMMLVFIWLALIYILIVFVDLSSLSFSKSPEVASSSSLFILLALIFGFLAFRKKLSLWRTSLLFVPLVFIGVYVGDLFPLELNSLSQSIGLSNQQLWSIILLLYCLIASISPVWALLQPRDYLSSFLLYGSLIGAFIGILFGGFEMSYPAFTDWTSINNETLFPILFITIACGACSGFHSIVSSGTTSKQLNSETDARKIGYGAMLIEGLVAVIALFTVAMLTKDSPMVKQDPLAVYGAGIGNFLSVLGLPFEMGQSFGILTISTFLLTTLDTSTRLGRYIFEEFFSLKSSRLNMILATLSCLLIPLMFNFIALHDALGNPIPVWKAIWPVFGATNQLLAGLALLVVYVWLKKKNKNTWFVAIPMVFMLSMTIWALSQLILQTGFTLVGIIAVALLSLSIILVIEAFRTILGESKQVIEIKSKA